jgi:hypothetical protein
MFAFQHIDFSLCALWLCGQMLFLGSWHFMPNNAGIIQPCTAGVPKPELGNEGWVGEGRAARGRRARARGKPLLAGAARIQRGEGITA